MMISSKGRYALRVMLDLAQHEQEGYLSLKEISQRQDISMKYLEQIVALLNKGGMLESRRGKDGGYRLARRPAEYPISEIIGLTEGSLAPVACLDCGEEPACPRSRQCRTLPMWQELDRRIDAYLESVTLKDLLEQETP